LPMADGSSLKSSFGFIAAALLPAFSSAPPAIHALMMASSASGILGELGGILGSSECDTSSYKRELSGSPGSMTAPEPPPLRVLPKVSSESPPFCLSALWHELQRAWKIADTWSANVTFASSGAADRATRMIAASMLRSLVEYGWKG